MRAVCGAVAGVHSVCVCNVPPTMPTVIFVESFFMNAIMLSVTSPRGIVSVPSTSKSAKMRGFAQQGALSVVAMMMTKASPYYG